jgi:hypothetical protein
MAIATKRMTRTQKADALSYLLNVINEANGDVGSLWDAIEKNDLKYVDQEHLDAYLIVREIIRRVSAKGTY